MIAECKHGLPHTVIECPECQRDEALAEAERWKEAAQGWQSQADREVAYREQLRAALREIHGCFLPGERNTYMPGDLALDRIRTVAEEALGVPVFAEQAQEQQTGAGPNTNPNEEN